MRYCVPLLLFLARAHAFGQHHEHPSDRVLAPSLMPGLGKIHHPISTHNPEAQRFFDQGLSLIYAFNHEEAGRSFERAAALDSQCAMAYWGIALAVGPNYNDPVPDQARIKAANDAIQKALSLSSHAPENERAYVSALAKRYSADPKADLKQLGLDYKKAMGELSRRYPADPDAATLYAESAMDLRPWKLWTPDGKPAEGTEEILATLESVIARNPDHTGANHYYVHAIEASPHPEKALASAERLKTLAPAAGHLVHMPAHIQMRLGDYRGASQSNEQAVKADQVYISAYHVTGMYPIMYYPHNLHFLAVASSMEGNFANAQKAARQLAATVAPGIKEMPMVEMFMPNETLVLMRFRHWEEILKLPEPDASMAITRVIWRFARGIAFAEGGKVQESEAELRAFLDARKALPDDTLFGLNPAGAVLGVAGFVLDARIAEAKKDSAAAVAALKNGIAAEDALSYDEPPAWYLPTREALGGLLLRSGNAKDAESVFRADLARNKNNGRSLFGLCESLKAQGKTDEAKAAERDFKAAWKNADTKLRLEDL